MIGPRPAEGRVIRSYSSDGAQSYRRSGHPDVTPKYDNSNIYIFTLHIQDFHCAADHRRLWVRLIRFPFLLVMSS